MPPISIAKGNSLFKDKKYQQALDVYLSIQKREPDLANIIKMSIERCQKAIKNNEALSLASTDQSSSSKKINKTITPNTKDISVRFFPDYSKSNPYQKLLYSDCPSNIKITPGTIEEVQAELELKKAFRTVFHLHWVSFVLAGATSEDDATARINIFLEKLKKFTTQGGELVWTIHNSLEHDCKYPDIEKALRKGICDLAHRIHIHSEATIEDIENNYPLPKSKLVVVPHGNYVGCYRDFCTRETARRQLGITNEEIVFLSLGQIRPYKGLDIVLNAFSKIHQDFPKTRLLIAGKVAHPYSPDHLSSIINSYDGVSLFPYAVSDTELQYYFRAADATILSYKNILTSGSIYLSLSFGCPVIAPDFPAISEVIENGANGFLYNHKNPEASLKDALIKFCNSGPQEISAMGDQAEKDIKLHDWKNSVKLLFDTPEEQDHLSKNTRSFNIEFRTTTCEIALPKTETVNTKVAIVILNYKSTEDTEELVESISNLNRKDINIILVDNHSPNESINSLQGKFPQCTIIRTNENLGYAAGNNIGIRYAEEKEIPYIWILNPDTVIGESTLDALLYGAEKNPETDIWGSLITYYDRPETLWFAGGFVSFEPECTIGHMYHDKPLGTPPQEPYEVDYVTGASIFCRTAIFKRAGLIPEHYFLYFEETDWCTNARRVGLKIQINPQSVLLHKKRSQVGNMPTKYYIYYFIRGAMLFRRRYSSHDVVQSRSEVIQSFVQPWLERIEKFSPEDYPFFQKLAFRALADGERGVCGPQDLKTILSSTEWHTKKPSEIITGKFKILPDNRIIGWAINHAQTCERLKVAVNIDGNFLGFASLSQTPEHLEFAENNSQKNGFIFLLPEEVIDSSSHKITLYAEEIEIGTIEHTLQPNTQPAHFIGRLDGIQDRFMKGWCFDECNPQRSLTIHIYQGDQLVASGTNNILRPDLIKAGLKTEKAGFCIPIPLDFCDGNEYNFILKAEEQNQPIHSRSLRMDTRKYPTAPPQSSLDTLLQWLYTRREISFTQKSNKTLPAIKELNDKKEILFSKAKENPQNKLVSIIMPVYNRANVVETAINSIKSQTYENWELIICDDGSSDNSTEIIKRIISEENLHSKIHLIESKQNQGVSTARNIALSRAKGAYIAYLDSDNTWDSEYLSIMTSSLDELNTTGCVYCGDRIVQHYQAEDKSKSETIALRLGHLNRTLIENKNYIDLNVFMHSIEIYNNLGGFRNDMSRLVDWELILRYTQAVQVRFVPAILATYNLDACDNQITRTQDYNQNATKLKETLSNIQATKISSGKVSTSEQKSIEAILINNGQQSNFFESLGYDSWINSCPNLKLTIITQSSSPDSPPYTIEKSFNIREITVDKSQVNTLVKKAIQDAAHTPNKAIVIFDTNVIPSTGWLTECLNIENHNNNVGAITGALFASGQKAASIPDVIFKNSRNDFNFDLTPTFLDLEKINIHHSLTPTKEVKIDSLPSFFYYLTSEGIKALAPIDTLPSEAPHIHHSNILKNSGLKIIYSTNLRLSILN